MRWDNLRLDSTGPDDGTGPYGGTAAPPLIERNAVMRTFDTPGFRGMTFYEIHAKSIVSRVPEASKVPFRYTINPYRGCQHACSYCLGGFTPILMADGTTRPLADVRVGDGSPWRTGRGSSPAAITGSSPSAAGSMSPGPSRARTSGRS